MRKRTDSSNAIVANTTCPNPTPSVRKPPGTSGDEYGVGRAGEPEHDLDLDAPRRGGADEPLDAPPARVVVGALDDVGADPAEPFDRGVERGDVDGLEADRNRVVGRAGLHHEPLGAIVVAPGARACRRLAGNEPDDIGQHGRERVGLRKLDDEVAELDLVVHRRGPLGRSQRRVAASRGKSRSVFARSASSSEPGGSPAVSRRSVAIGGDELGGERDVAAVVEVLERRDREQRVQLARDRRPG